ncbi:hypothetical protein FGG08_001824 [Glutinoglossum americanum]|uniref:Uncharacterized protein n=1 Tax=Glutinoglossum americanum TaxID=1670608 RepID=A0A9P8IAF8_9PEZI|nr:hypothetical protein FGG08_001824 [Glutinoglossum americanum]
MATWRDRGYVPASDDEDEVEEDEMREGKDGVAETPFPPGDKRREELKVNDDDWYDIDELSNEYEGLYGRTGRGRDGTDISKLARQCRIEKESGGADGGPQLSSPKSDGNDMTAQVEADGLGVYNGEVVDLVDVGEVEGSESSPEEVLFEISKALVVKEAEEIRTPVADRAQVRPFACTVDEQLGEKSHPTTPTSGVNIHRSIGSALEIPSVDMDCCSPSSSTLSSPPTTLSTPGGSPQGPQAQMTRYSFIKAVIPQLSNRHQQIRSEPTANGDIESEPTRKLSHTLRKRNPIQLHPYLIEDQRYKQSLKARGIKPVRVVEVQSQVIRVTRTRDLQEQEFQAEDDSQSNEINGISEDVGSSQPEEAGNSRISVEDDTQSPVEGNSDLRASGDDEDFPDVDTLLRRQLSGAVQQGYKRRKTKPAGLKRPPRSSPAGESAFPARKPSPSVKSSQIASETEHLSQQTIFDFPVSPSHSTAHTISRPTSPTTPSFRFPKGFAPQTRQENRTPVAAKRRVTIESSEESDSEPRPSIRRAKPSRDSSRSASPSPTSSSEEETMVQLRSVQRKMRGVLPASWLRLDQQGQTRAIEPQTKGDRWSRYHPPAKPTDRPGLARRKPISRSLSTSTVPSNFIEISDDSDDASSHDHSNGSPYPPQPHPDSQTSAGLLQMGLDFGEAEEDNCVDTMGPSTKNLARHTGKPRKKRQRRLSDSFGISDSRPPLSIPSSKSASGHVHQPKIIDRLPRRKSTAREGHVGRKLRIPKLSILDAPKSNIGSKRSTPPFLRIANRQARSRRDKARHSPSGKVIRLHTWGDTQDVQSVLRDWREGTILPVAEFAPSTIQNPLHARCSDAKLEKKQTRLPPPLPKPWRGNQESVVRLNPVVHRPSVSRALASGQTRKPLQPRTLAQVNAGPRSFPVPPSEARGGPRPAQLEVLEAELPNLRRRAAFVADLSLLDRLYQKQVMVSPRGSNLQLARFLADGDENTATTNPLKGVKAQNSSRSQEQAPTLDPVIPKAVTRRPRKRPPKRFNLGPTESSLPERPILIEGRRAYAPSIEGDKGKVVLQGLSPYGTYYSFHFGVVPLKIGTYFHESTFIGSGDLSKALQTASKRDYHLHAGYATLNSTRRLLQWGSWDDTVSSELESEFDWLALSMEQLCNPGPTKAEGGRALGLALESKQLLKFVIVYFKDFLSFADPIDRNSFVRRSTQILQRLLERLAAISNPQFHRDPDQLPKLITQTSTSLLTLIYQVLQIAKRGSLEAFANIKVEELLKSTARWLIRLLLHQDPKQIRSFYKDNQRLPKVGDGIREDNYLVEGWVVLIQILNQPEDPTELFWSLLNEQLGLDKIFSVTDVQFFEQSWYGIISMLPLFEFDEFGVFEVGRHFRHINDNWKFVKALTSQLLAIYTSNPRKQAATFNDYCRTVFSRCHYLIKDWGWKKCEAIVGVLFDFFASNNLAHLYKEDIRGSPRFLEQLDQHQSLEIEPEDKCFHILLKTIGVGLKAMGQIYPERKIRNITFRLMPNHGRQYPKEEPVLREDLESLRNHHNLLCTLYWASPPSSRPPINAIRDLVNPETSHREACHVSLRAWSNLVRFQLSTNEPASSLEPFMRWHNDLTSQMLKQHGLARTEAQAHFAASTNAVGITAISPKELEKTIGDNQKQVEAVLSDALVSMRNAMAVVKSVDLAMALFSRSSTADVFQLFDSKKYGPNKVVLEAIAITQEYIRIFYNGKDSQQTSYANEDSQDYGDWSALEDIVSQELSGEAVKYLRDTVYDSLLRLVSNCYGADVAPDDALLLKVTDTWVSVAQSLVKGGLKQWNNFIGSYSRESWSSLRSTEQTRKFTTYFMSKVIESDAASYKTNKSFFLCFWMSSLVERESLLKFQYRFTNMLLNHDRDNLILTNLPFWVNKGSNGYAITALEFRERRLSLISCKFIAPSISHIQLTPLKAMLANMRESVEESALVSARETTVLRQEYAELLKALMGSMKSNYEEIRQGSTCSGAYVEFVQKVVESLQQHTIEICPVDKFFTDSSAFPLPAADPTYVVGRLKNYGLRLSEPRVHTQLAMFLQSVSERAAAEQQQSYLTGQLYTAMSDTFESGDVKKPTLRAFLTQAIFPAYIEAAFTSTGWILARSVLRALERMFDALLTDVDSGDSACVESVIAISAHVLDSFRRSVDLLITHSGLLEQSTILNTLTSFFSTITSMLRPLDYLQRRSHRGAHAVRSIAFFTAFASFISQVLEDHQDEAVSPYVTCPDFPPLPTPYLEARNSSTQDLRAMLKKNWSRRGDEYHVIRGNTIVEVVVEIGSFEEEKARLLEGLNDYLDVVGSMTALQCVRRGGRERKMARALLL